MTPTRRSHITLRQLALLLIAYLAGTLSGGVAVAGNWNDEDTIYKIGTDTTVRFDQCNLSTNTHDAFHANNDHDISPTDVTPQLFHSCDEVDVRINDTEFGLDMPKGFYHCHQLISPQVCGNAHAHINRSYPDIPENYGPTEHVVCEEIGHSLGLAHLPGSSELPSCMVIDDNRRHLSDHDQNHINAHYD